MSYYVLGKYNVEREIYIVEAESEAEAIAKLQDDLDNGDPVKLELMEFSDISSNQSEIHVIDGAFGDYDGALHYVESEVA